MPRQNRVTPFGDIIVSSTRGMLMGNRGCLHDASGRIIKRSARTAWIYCLLEFKGRKRQPLMAPGQYTELFFLDEATALAAGHRPCAECQRGRYKVFLQHWGAANAERLANGNLDAKMLDVVLQQERIDSTGSKAKHRASLGTVPAGCFVMLDERPDDAYLVQNAGLRMWHPEGYDPRIAVPTDVDVAVLTPPSVANAFAAGFSPHVADNTPRAA